MVIFFNLETGEPVWGTANGFDETLFAYYKANFKSLEPVLPIALERGMFVWRS